MMTLRVCVVLTSSLIKACKMAFFVYENAFLNDEIEVHTAVTRNVTLSRLMEGRRRFGVTRCLNLHD
jgi:hypothetical protein